MVLCFAQQRRVPGVLPSSPGTHLILEGGRGGPIAKSADVVLEPVRQGGDLAPLRTCLERLL